MVISFFLWIPEGSDVAIADRAQQRECADSCVWIGERRRLAAPISVAPRVDHIVDDRQIVDSNSGDATAIVSKCFCAFRSVCWREKAHFGAAVRRSRHGRHARQDPARRAPRSSFSRPQRLLRGVARFQVLEQERRRYLKISEQAVVKAFANASRRFSMAAGRASLMARQCARDRIEGGACPRTAYWYCAAKRSSESDFKRSRSEVVDDASDCRA